MSDERGEAEPSPEPSPEAGPEPRAPLAVSPLQRRLAPVVLLVGLGLALLLFARHYPRETEVVFRLEGARSSLVRLSVSFAATGGDEDAGASWAFGAGKAPPSVRTTVRLPPGPVDVTASMEIEGGPPDISRRKVSLEGGTVTVPLRVAAPGE